MGRINSKDKGRRGEQQLVKKLKEYGFETRRTVQYNGKAEEGQADLIGLPNIHIECKRTEKLKAYDFIDQVKRDKKSDELGVIFHKRNNCEWICILTLDDFIKLYKESNYSDMKEGE